LGAAFLPLSSEATRVVVFIAFRNESDALRRNGDAVMSLVIYERVGHEGCRPSPFSWRVRYALAHKNLAAEFRQTRFADVETIRSLSGQKFVPILLDGETVVYDSWNIATYLEDRFPDHPSLFGGLAGRGVTRLVNHWADTTLHFPLRLLIFPDFIQCICPEDRDYFICSREQEYGMTVEQVRQESATWRTQFEAACLPLEQLLGEQEFVAGHAAGYADYIVFSHFLRANLCGRRDVVAPNSAIALWQTRMFGLFRGRVTENLGPAIVDRTAAGYSLALNGVAV
jgi:glutathione S-transferase